jgi:hypothetical protein
MRGEDPARKDTAKPVSFDRRVKSLLRFRHIAPYFSRGLVLAQILIDHLAQKIILCPGEKLDLGDELGPYPMDAAQHQG